MTSVEDRLIFWISVIILTVLSSFGSLFIIISILLKWRKDFSSRLVLYLSTADFCLSILCLAFCAYNLHHGELQNQGSFICQFQPVVTWYFMEVSILWLVMIAINSVKVVTKNVGFTIQQEIIANVICWGIPIITTTIPLNSNTGEYYGQRNDLWCSFAENQKGPQLLNLMAYYIPALIIISCCYIYILCLLKRYLRSENRSTEEQKTSTIKRLFLFVLAYFIVWTPLTMSYVYEYTSQQFVPFEIEFIFDNMLHIQGLLNFIIYGINDELIQKIRKKILNISSQENHIIGMNYI